MFTEYINILGECSKDILINMANIDIGSVKIRKDEHLKTTYSIAHNIKYNDFDEKLKGNFMIGFDETVAILVSSAIAENFGLTPIKQFDETAADIINEFLNTVVGRTISEWDKKGLNVRFSPPASVKNKSINISDDLYTEANLIIPEFSQSVMIHDKKTHCLNIMVTFTKTMENKLLQKRILVVDDSSVIRKILSKAFEKSGFKVEQAKNGREAINKYKIFKPHLTIMDLLMPNMGGLDAIIEIQEFDPEAKFVVLTSSSRKDEVVSAKTLKVLSYIIKPLNMENFLANIKKLFEQIAET
jgi:two-component system, chemotaxis family, chemotaxis protein CheY